MKRFIIIMSLVLSSLAVSAHNHKHECNHDHESEAVAVSAHNHDHELESSEVAPQDYVKAKCRNCEGKGWIMNYDMFGNYNKCYCGVCGGHGFVWQKNISFKGSYYGKCQNSGCDCQYFVARRSGSDICTCGHPRHGKNGYRGHKYVQVR